MSLPAPASPPSARSDGPASADLDRLFVLSAGREVSTEVRERLALRLDPDRGPNDAFDEWVVLHTCHRVELIAVTSPTSALPSLPAMVPKRGPEAIDHLLRVAAGLDSAVLAEEQVLGQVRDAYATALARRQTGPILNELLRRAIRVGKRARAMAIPGADRSLGHRAMRWVDERQQGGRALLLGSGVIAREVAEGMAGRGFRLSVASHRVDRAMAIVAGLPGDGHAALEARDAVRGGQWSVVVAATRTRGPLLALDDFEHLDRALVVDLCAPSAVSSDLVAALGDRLLDLDRLGRDDPESAVGALSPASQRRLARDLRDERDTFMRWLAERTQGDTVAVLRRHADALRERHLDRLRRRGLLDPPQLAAADHMARALIAELLHRPTLQLREGGPEAAEVRALFGLDR